MLNSPKHKAALGILIVLGAVGLCTFLYMSRSGNQPGTGREDLAGSPAGNVGQVGAPAVPGTPALVEPARPAIQGAPAAVGAAPSGNNLTVASLTPGHPQAGAPHGLQPGGQPVQAQGSLAPQPGTLAEAPKDSCYSVSYRHRHPGAKPGDEVCSHHKNPIRLKSAQAINPKSVCIRVNGAPVKFSAVSGKKNEFLLGTVVGTETTVTARYCTGKMKCNESCNVPKDKFVEAIGGSDDMDSNDKQKLAIAVWDKEDPADRAADGKLEKDMHKELKDLDEVSRAAAEGYTIFGEWTAEAEVPGCTERKVAAH